MLLNVEKKRKWNALVKKVIPTSGRCEVWSKIIISKQKNAYKNTQVVAGINSFFKPKIDSFLNIICR